MASFRNCHHDFPRLAKQSGYFFQLYRGRVNWSEIENLNIDDIIDNKNFQMLEKHLINVVNCNLEREYDLKVLDRNFVKLFKLAQLGVDYLSYCELYLDRCVVLLQEQLIALQEEYQLLKQENTKRNEELGKSKKKDRIQNYQCEKCHKVFISEVYLKCHEKRRHCKLETYKSLEGSPKTFIDKYQQTEMEEKEVLASTKNFLYEKQVKTDKEHEEIEVIKKENQKKIENLEKELEDVKNRLKKAENTWTTNCEAPNPNVPQSLNLPGPIFYPAMLQWIPSCLPQSRNNFFNYNQGYQTLVSENQTRESSNFSNEINSREVSTKNLPDIEYILNLESISNLHDKTSDKENEVINDKGMKNDIPTKLKENNIQHNITPKPPKKMNFEKENIDPRRDKVFVTSEKPLPFPRKIKKTLYQTDIEPDIEEQSLVEKTPQKEFEVLPDSFSHDSITHSSTPLKGKEIRVDEDISGHQGEKSSASFSNIEISSMEQKPKSFFKKILVKKSPKFQELSKNLRISLTNLYDSISYGGKDPGKRKELESTVMDGLHEELRNLGVDPEWSGIPKNTVHQKLKMLKHRRKLMTKENPLYPVVRKGIEKNILKRLDNYININEKKKKFQRESNEQEPMEPQSPDMNGHIFINTQKKKTVLTLDVETELESEYDKLETSSDTNREQKMSWQKPDKEFDFSVFQVNKEKESKSSKTDVLFDDIEDLEIESDLESQSEDFENSSSRFLENEVKSGEKISNNDIKDQWAFSGRRHQHTLKDTIGSLSKPQTCSKKKVVFVDLSESEEHKTSEVGKKMSPTSNVTAIEAT